MNQILILYTGQHFLFFFKFLRPSISSFSMKGNCLMTFWKMPTCVNIFDSYSWSPRFVLTPPPYIFEVQMWWHGSIDGYASDTRGPGLGQQQWALHRNACSTGTLGHMHLPLQPFYSSRYPTIPRWWDAAAASFVHWPCGSGRCYSGCQTGWGILTEITWPCSFLVALPFHPNLWTLPATASFSRCVHGRAGNLPSLPTGLPPVQIN